MSYLDDIGAWTAGEVARRRIVRPFGEALLGERLSIIAEVKRSSPSQGAIAADADPAEVARRYAADGAAAISVLTSGRDFGGSLADLEAVRKAVDLPLLCKDFMVDPWQVVEARTHGADAILVILGLVTDELAQELVQQAEDLELDVLCEVHTEEELARALRLGMPIIGVNARDLRTLEIDAVRQRAMLHTIPQGYITVAESGIESAQDARLAHEAGAMAALVGTALMRDPSLLAELVGRG